MAPPSTMFTSCNAHAKSFYQTCLYDMPTLDQNYDEILLSRASSLCNFRKTEDVVEENTNNQKNSIKIEITDNDHGDCQPTNKEYTPDPYLGEFIHGPNLPSIPEHAGEESPRSETYEYYIAEKSLDFSSSPSDNFLERCLHSGKSFIRQNSLPVELYSYLGTKTRNPMLVPVNGVTGNHQLHMLQSSKNSHEMANYQASNGDPLLRQHSLPASALAHFSQDRDMSVGFPFLSPSQSEAFHSINEHGRNDVIRKRSKIDETVFKEKGGLGSQRTNQKEDGGPLALRSSVAGNKVICKSRAKRGCATHPRSIAERVRRTKISERIKRLYDLFPNLDKQRHTADMLDQVVDYVKSLQHQVQILSVTSCSCGRENENS